MEGEVIYYYGDFLHTRSTEQDLTFACMMFSREIILKKHLKLPQEFLPTNNEYVMGLEVQSNGPATVIEWKKQFIELFPSTKDYVVIFYSERPKYESIAVIGDLQVFINDMIDKTNPFKQVPLAFECFFYIAPSLVRIMNGVFGQFMNHSIDFVLPDNYATIRDNYREHQAEKSKNVRPKRVGHKRPAGQEGSGKHTL